MFTVLILEFSHYSPLLFYFSHVKTLRTNNHKCNRFIFRAFMKIGYCIFSALFCSIKDVERIKALKACPSMSKEQKQGMKYGGWSVFIYRDVALYCELFNANNSFHLLIAPSDATSTAISTRSRTYNTRTNSSKQTAQTVQRYCWY